MVSGCKNIGRDKSKILIDTKQNCMYFFASIDLIPKHHNLENPQPLKLHFHGLFHLLDNRIFSPHLSLPGSFCKAGLLNHSGPRGDNVRYGNDTYRRGF